MRGEGVVVRREGRLSKGNRERRGGAIGRVDWNRDCQVDSDIHLEWNMDS